MLGVADLDEAFELRAAGIDAPVLAWLHDPDADVAARCRGRHHDRRQLARPAAAVSPRPATAAPYTSRSTLACRATASLEPTGALVIEELAHAVDHDGLRLGGVFSHLSNTSPDEDREQLVAFEEFLDAVRSAGLDPGIRHLAASAGALDHPAARYDMVRLGIALYGLPPEDHHRDLPLRPAMELSAAVVHVKTVPAGSGVSYGFRYRTARATRLALVPLGYADGIPRHTEGASVLIGEHRLPVVGRVAMDQFVVDVGEAPVSVGDRVVLFGDPATGAPSAVDWADAAGTISYEIVTRLGRRVTRTRA